jgi:hypothetical protein
MFGLKHFDFLLEVVVSFFHDFIFGFSFFHDINQILINLGRFSESWYVHGQLIFKSSRFKHIHVDLFESDYKLLWNLREIYDRFNVTISDAEILNRSNRAEFIRWTINTFHFAWDLLENLNTIICQTK